MKENEGGEGIQKTEEVLLEEGKAEISIEPEVVLVPAGVLEEKETTELSEDPCRSTAEDDNEEEFCKVGFWSCYLSPPQFFHLYVLYELMGTCLYLHNMLQVCHLVQGDNNWWKGYG